jgi:hypothetical protein
MLKFAGVGFGNPPNAPISMPIDAPAACRAAPVTLMVRLPLWRAWEQKICTWKRSRRELIRHPAAPMKPGAAFSGHGT